MPDLRFWCRTGAGGAPGARRAAAVGRLVALTAVALTGVAAHAGPPAPVPFDLAVTLDDLPFVGGVGPGDTVERATGRILAALRGVPVTGLVVCRRMEQPHILRQWRAAGAALGNHTTSHRDISELTEDAWTEEVRSCSRAIERAVGQPVRFFRFPMLHQGTTAARRDAALATLRRLGLANAPVSIDTADWIAVKPYVQTLEGRDARARAAGGRAYVEHVVAAVRHYREVARRRVGRDVAHVLLLHANALAADHLPALLAALRAQGARFVTLEQALADPVYRRPDAYAGPIGMSWLYRFAPATPAAWTWDRDEERALARRMAALAPASAPASAPAARGRR